jgi:hypothetical protein
VLFFTRMPHRPREFTRLGAVRVAGGAVLANRLGDVAGELVWGALARAPAGAGALVRAAGVDAAGVAGWGGIGQIHSAILLREICIIEPDVASWWEGTRFFFLPLTVN